MMSWGFKAQFGNSLKAQFHHPYIKVLWLLSENFPDSEAWPSLARFGMAFSLEAIPSRNEVSSSK